MNGTSRRKWNEWERETKHKKWRKKSPPSSRLWKNVFLSFSSCFFSVLRTNVKHKFVKAAERGIFLHILAAHIAFASLLFFFREKKKLFRGERWREKKYKAGVPIKQEGKFRPLDWCPISSPTLIQPAEMRKVINLWPGMIMVLLKVVHKLVCFAVSPSLSIHRRS